MAFPISVKDLTQILYVALKRERECLLEVNADLRRKHRRSRDKLRKKLNAKWSKCYEELEGRLEDSQASVDLEIKANGTLRRALADLQNEAESIKHGLIKVNDKVHTLEDTEKRWREQENTLVEVIDGLNQEIETFKVQIEVWKEAFRITVYAEGETPTD